MVVGGHVPSSVGALVLSNAAVGTRVGCCVGFLVGILVGILVGGIVVGFLVGGSVGLNVVSLPPPRLVGMGVELGLEL